MASRVLNEVEGRVLISEQSMPRMRWLHPDAFHNLVVDLIGEISLMTGAFIHADGSPEQAFQVEIIKRLLVTSPAFYSLNKDEIVQAFYMNAAGIFTETYRHYNREINVEFIGDVLRSYVEYKKRFLGTKLADIQKLLNPPKQKATPPGPSLDEWMDMINQDLQLVRAGQGEMVFNALMKYRVLRELGYIEIRSRAHWWEWYRCAIRIQEQRVLRQVASTEGQKADRSRVLDYLNAILERAEIEKSQHRTNVHRMRREIYLAHLRLLAYFGIKDIFEEVEPYPAGNS